MKALLTLCVALLATSAHARDYYVANGGNDTGEGTQRDPWATISQVNGFAFQPGDRILFNGGDTWAERLNISRSGSPGKHITFTSYGDGKAILSEPAGESYCFSNTSPQSYITIRDINLVNCSIRFYNTAAQSTDIIIEHMDISGGKGSAGILLTKVANVTIRNNEIHDMQGSAHGIYNDGTEGVNDNTIIEMNHIYNGDQACVQANSNGVGRITNSSVRYNYFHDCRVACMNNVGGDNLLIHNNIMLDCNSAIYNACNQLTGGCLSTGSIDTVIENNTLRVTRDGFSACYSSASATGGQPTWKRFTNNVCIFDATSGYAIEATTAATDLIDNNIWWTTVNSSTDLNWTFGGPVWSGFYEQYQPAGNEPNSEYVDPDFITSMETDWYPNTGSPVLDAGTQAGSIGMARDYIGVPVPFGAEIDIGAVEGGGQSIPRPPKPENVVVQ